MREPEKRQLNRKSYAATLLPPHPALRREESSNKYPPLLTSSLAPIRQLLCANFHPLRTFDAVPQCALVLRQAGPHRL